MSSSLCRSNPLERICLCQGLEQETRALDPNLNNTQLIYSIQRNPFAPISLWITLKKLLRYIYEISKNYVKNLSYLNSKISIF